MSLTYLLILGTLLMSQGARTKPPSLDGYLGSASPRALADETKEEAIKKDRERYAGKWQAVSLEIDGTKHSDADTKSITVINYTDGNWILYIGDEEAGRGSSQIDPTKKPKTIDFVSDAFRDLGMGNLGIYEIDGDTRKVCFGFGQSGRDRPADFSAKKGSIVAVFKRVGPVPKPEDLPRPKPQSPSQPVPRPQVPSPPKPSWVALLKHSAVVNCVAFTPDGTLLASGSRNGAVMLWSVASKREEAGLGKHANSVISLAFTRDGKLLASGSSDGMVKIWDVTARRQKAMVKGDIEAVSVTFSPDGTLLAWGDYKTVKVWDMAADSVKYAFRQRDDVTCVAFSPDGKVLTAGNRDATVKAWDVSTGREQFTLEHGDQVKALAFSPDGKLLATGGHPNVVKLWDVSTRQQTAVFTGHRWEVLALAFSSDGKLLASASSDETAKIWDLKVGKARATRDGPGYGAVNSVAFSPDGKLLAVARGDRVTLWPVPEI